MKRMFGLAVVAIATLSPTWLSAGEQEDKEFAKQVAVALKESGQMQDYSVGVKCKNGTVWLAGRVTSQQQLASALRIVSDLDGVQQIVNNMQIDEPAPAEASQSGTRLRQFGNSARTAAAPQQQVQLASNNAMAPAQMPQQPPAQSMRAMPRGTPRAYAPSSQAAPAGYASMPGGPQGASAGHGRPMAGGPGRVMPVNMTSHAGGGGGGYGGGQPIPAYVPGSGGGVAPVSHDAPHMPNYSWPSYAAYPNYAALSYPKQYSASAFPFIGPFYPYPQVPLGWRKVSLEWDDGWWFLDFDDQGCH